MKQYTINFIKELTKNKTYGLLFLKIYKTPNAIFGMIQSEFINTILKNEIYFPLWLNTDFIKLIKLCFDDEEFLRRISSESCFNISCFLEHMANFKKGYSKSAEEREDLDIDLKMRPQEIQDYACKKSHFEKYKNILAILSEEQVEDFDEGEMWPLQINITKHGKFIFKNYEKPTTQKVEIYKFFEKNGLNNLVIEIGEEKIFADCRQGQLYIPNELIYAFVCENKFLSVVCKYLDTDKEHDENNLMTIYKILELGLKVKEKSFEISDRYQAKCETLIKKETIDSFDCALAKTLMSSITAILIQKEKAKTKSGFTLIKGNGKA